MTKVLFIFGTRPEAIKLAPLINRFRKNNRAFETRVCITAQHREMLDQVLNFFEIAVDYDLDLMKKNQNLYTLTATIIQNLKSCLDHYRPDYVFVHGDTTTTMAASIASFYAGAKVCHVEAGLRTNNKNSPFPEEMNRQITSKLADYHFAPTSTAKENLKREGIEEKNIFITGNTVIDSLLFGIKKIENTKGIVSKELKEKVSGFNEIVLVTGHRRENHGDGFDNICKALLEISMRKPEVLVVYPVHLNPNVQDPVHKYLSGINNIVLMEPLDYADFIWLMNKSKIILTDSGGIQEEAPSLKKPVLVMRNTTERPEAVEAGTVKLVGTDKDKIVSETIKLLTDNQYYTSMSQAHNPYGDGKASLRIVDYLRSILES